MRLTGVKKTYEGEYLSGYNLEYVNSANETKVYEMVSHNKNLENEIAGHRDRDLKDIKVEAVGIIAFNEDYSEILLQNEFRLACNDWVYNFPGGMVDAGETPYEAAERELYEETGLNIFNIIDYMPPCYSAVGFTDETIATVICQATGEFMESTSPNEEIKVGWYTKEQVRNMLKTCRISMRTQSFLYCWVNGYIENHK